MIRTALLSDMPQITHVRTSVQENHMSVADLARYGVTEESMANDISAGFLGAWVAELETRIVAFSKADKRNGNIFALFTLPGHENRSFGTGLLNACENYQRTNGHRQANLDTARNTIARSFYLNRGWNEVSAKPDDPTSVIMHKDL